MGSVLLKILWLLPLSMAFRGHWPPPPFFRPPSTGQGHGNGQSQSQRPFGGFKPFNPFQGLFYAFQRPPQSPHLPPRPQIPHGNETIGQMPQIQVPQAPMIPQTPKNKIPDDLLKFAEEGLEAHNKYRRAHGVPPLELDLQLIQDSLAWASAGVATSSVSAGARHSPGHVGENIYIFEGAPGRPATNLASLSVENWYNEISMYNWLSPLTSHGTGHFTQVIWKGSKRMGMALAKNGDTVLIVAQYQPPGNMAYDQAMKENVPPPLVGGSGGVVPQVVNM